jgi:IS5 family transposase
MAEGGSRRSDRQDLKQAEASPRRRRRTVKPLNWPRYMIGKRLASGAVAYYWNARNADIAAGFKLHREPLGTDYGGALKRAADLNAFLDAWRAGRDDKRSLDAGPRFGTVDWWLECYVRSTAFGKLKERTKPTYRYQLSLLADLPTKAGSRLGDLPAAALTPAAVDKIYEALRGGPEGTKLRRANHTIDIAKKAWTVVQRTHPKQFFSSNPFVGLTRLHARSAIQHATRAEAAALSEALIRYGHPHLAVVPLACFEWLQRPENILAGHLRWTDYRPLEKPHHVRIVHHKTGQVVWHPLEAFGERFYPELEELLTKLTKIAVPIVVTLGRRGAARPYSFSYAKRIVREARRAAGLPEHITMTACRHGGMTELGDAELTEQGVMSLSGHRTPDAARGYIKRTETQRLAAARKRRAWVQQLEHSEYESQNERQIRESE